MSEAAVQKIDRWGLAACLLIGLALRGFAVWGQADELTHERDGYLGLAQSLVEGRGFCGPGSPTPTAFRPPLYSLQLAALLWLVPAGVAVAAVNLLWGAMTIWTTWRAGEWLGLGWGKALATLLVAVDPLLVQYTVQPMTETTCTGLVALLLLWMVRRDGREGWRQWSVGALFGLVVLCRPAFWPFAGLMAILWCVRRVIGCGAAQEGSSPHRARPGGSLACALLDPATPHSAQANQRSAQASQSSAHASEPPRQARWGGDSSKCLPWRTIVGTLLVVAPWVIRNQLVFGSPILTTTHGGYTLLLANNPVFYDEVVDRPWGTVWQKESLVKWQTELLARLERDLGANASELDRDRRQSTLAWEYIAAEPLRFARAVWHRVRSLWSPVPHGEAAAGVNRWLIAVVGWYYTLVLLAFAVGLIVVARRRDRSRWWVLYALVVTVQVVHLVYWTNARMRAPLTPLIALFAAAAVSSSREQSASCDSSAQPAR